MVAFRVIFLVIFGLSFKGAFKGDDFWMMNFLDFLKLANPRIAMGHSSVACQKTDGLSCMLFFFLWGG